MKVKLLLCVLLTMQVRASDSLHFMRKIIAAAAGICVAYGFEQDKAEDVVRFLHNVFNTKVDPNSVLERKQYKSHVKYPAYGVRAIAGLLAMSFLNAVLDHED